MANIWRVFAQVQLQARNIRPASPKSELCTSDACAHFCGDLKGTPGRSGLIHTARLSNYCPHFDDTDVTTPWIACVPKCPVAGPVYTIVKFENSTSVPPVIQICSVDGPLDSKDAGPPFPEVVAGVLLITIPEPVVAGLKAGQTLVSKLTVAFVTTM